MPNDAHDELGRFTFSEGGSATNSGKSDSAGSAIQRAASDKKSYTLPEAKQILKENKIGVGAKTTYVSNKVFISYPIHKFLDGSFHRDVEKVKSLFNNVPLDISRLGNTGGINIWIN